MCLFDPPKPNIARDHRQPEKPRRRTEDHHGRQPSGRGQRQSADGISADHRILTGPDLRQLSDEALLQRVVDVDVFAEIEPNQKERIILALKKAGNVVGYMGDGINDASALHAADVGISVDERRGCGQRGGGYRVAREGSGCPCAGRA